MPTATEIAIIAASLAVGSMFDARASDASGDAPRCAVIEIGVGDVAWDRQYLEQCVPNVLAGNRGNCTPNPSESAIPLKRHYKNSLAKEPSLPALVPLA
jgi:hypothetical protein